MANENLSPIQQLDAVLLFLAKSELARPFVTDAEILKHLTTVTLHGDELLRILNKLKKDGYIDYEDRQMPSAGAIQAPIGTTIRVYWVTWEGKLFADCEGYKGEIIQRGRTIQREVERAKEEAARVKALEIANEKIQHSIKASQKRMEAATWVMAGGSVILAIIEIIKLCQNR